MLIMMTIISMFGCSIEVLERRKKVTHKWCRNGTKNKWYKWQCNCITHPELSNWLRIFDCVKTSNLDVPGVDCEIIGNSVKENEILSLSRKRCDFKDNIVGKITCNYKREWDLEYLCGRTWFRVWFWWNEHFKRWWILQGLIDRGVWPPFLPKLSEAITAEFNQWLKVTDVQQHIIINVIVIVFEG